MERGLARVMIMVVQRKVALESAVAILAAVVIQLLPLFSYSRCSATPTLQLLLLPLSPQEPHLPMAAASEASVFIRTS